MDHIKGWTADSITRDQLFIMNFQSLITDSGNILHRLGKFLGLKEPWEEDTALPEVCTYKQRVQQNIACIIHWNPYNLFLVTSLL